MNVTIGLAFVATVDCEAVAARKLLSAGQLAFSKQVPLLWVIMTVVLETVHGPAAVMTGVELAFVAATTAKLLWYAAVAGAPVKVTAGAALFTTSEPVAEAATKPFCAAKLALRLCVPPAGDVMENVAEPAVKGRVCGLPPSTVSETLPATVPSGEVTATITEPFAP